MTSADSTATNSDARVVEELEPLHSGGSFMARRFARVGTHACEVVLGHRAQGANLADGVTKAGADDGNAVFSAGAARRERQ
ncbi:MAG: hypothetical protein ACKV22_01705 [Bryobacteraceae bacterium]